jgi:hypothetical protein
MKQRNTLNRLEWIPYASRMKSLIGKWGLIAALVIGLSPALSPLMAQELASKDFKVSELRFSKPDSWKAVQPRSSMRKAQLSVPAKNGGDAGEVVFFHFGPGNAGGTKANIDRWFRQFQEPTAKLKTRTEKSQVGDISVSFVHAEGTYMSGPPVGKKIAKADYSLLGAIIEAKKGYIFVKFTGPKTVVEAAEGDFKTMVTSAK